MAHGNSHPEFTEEERRILFSFARQALVSVVALTTLPTPDLETLPPALTKPGSCFVTLSRQGKLRGCTGSLVATSPLLVEVIRCTAQTATNDPRFEPIGSNELDDLDIEISVLTPSQVLQVEAPAHLPSLIRPGVDGVTLYHGRRRATFLPQVWERIPDPEDFLGMLCRKMNLPPSAWLEPGITVETYQAVTLVDEAA